ncbi:uncharacterized protein TNCV_3971291 [Trichonephila clavipes]|nr:uncharacterized protein TNCV_3971291 [Trichonephila clavipes]
MIVGSNGQDMVMPQEDWVTDGHVAQLRQLRARCPVACIPLTPSHCRLFRRWCQARAHWRTEWRSVMFSDENRLRFGAINGRMLVRRRPVECMQPNCL